MYWPLKNHIFSMMEFACVQSLGLFHIEHSQKCPNQNIMNSTSNAYTWYGKCKSKAYNFYDDIIL